MHLLSLAQNRVGGIVRAYTVRDRKSPDIAGVGDVEVIGDDVNVDVVFFLNFLDRERCLAVKMWWQI